MLGFENIGSQLRGLFNTSTRGAIEQALATLFPMFPALRPVIQKQIESRNFGLGIHKAKPVDSNTHDKGENDYFISTINSELGGTFSPIKAALNFFRRVFGSSSESRAIKAMGELSSAAELTYGTEAFANDNVKYLLNKLQQRVAQKQGWMSWLGLRKNPRVESDPVFKALSDAFGKWSTEPYMKVLRGELPGIGFYDYDFLSSILDQINHGYGSQYLKPLAKGIQDVLNEYQKIKARANQPTQMSPQQKQNLHKAQVA